MSAILTDTAIKKAKPKEKRYKLSDTQGLFLEVAPNGGKWWRLRYFWEGKEKLMSLGVYPQVSLKMAREKRDKARELLAAGENPSFIMRQREKVDDAGSKPTFSTVANQWYDFKSKNWAESNHKIMRLRVNKCIKAIPDKPFNELELDDFLPFIKSFEYNAKYEMCRRYAQLCSQICKYAKILKLIQYNPLEDISQILVTPKAKHMAAILQPEAIGKLLKDIDDYNGYSLIKEALRLMPYVFTRSGELRRAEWDEFDFDNALWTIPPERMKMRREHQVPLSKQALAILKRLKESSTSKLCFPSPMSKTRPISDVGLLNALRRLGYSREEMCIHGFRSIASTRLNEMGFRPDIIEMQLAHVDKSSVRAAYNRSTYLEERRDMMQKWADYLDGLRDHAIGRP